MRSLQLKMHSLWEDIMTTSLANLTLGFVILEQTRFTFMPVIHVLFLILTLYFWVSTLFKNGYVQRYSFLLYTALFFVSAQFSMWLFDYLVGLRIYNKYVDWINQVLKFWVIHPYKIVIDFLFEQFRLPLFSSLTVILIVYCAVFYAGYAVSLYRSEKKVVLKK